VVKASAKVILFHFVVCLGNVFSCFSQIFKVCFVKLVFKKSSFKCHVLNQDFVATSWRNNGNVEVNCGEKKWKLHAKA